MKDWKKIKQYLISFLKDEVSKAGFEKVTVGLSGGLDSAVVAILCKEAFGKNLNCVLMPSQFSSQSSIEHAIEVCEKFDIRYDIVSIEPMVSAFLKNMDNDKLRIGNFSARMRMSVLYDISFKEKSLVVGTSNKSELLLGYGTIFGDIACAINPIGEIYKSDEFEFAKLLGVPESILTKAPSADLWEGQSDEDELGHTYKEIDDLLKLMVDDKKSKDELLKLGFEASFIDKINNRMKANAFKGKLPTIAKLGEYL
ncbi:NAD+ synthase [Aliarcobacter butzleri]|jgi:NAD+ synthase|uniref:NH(3)-dependent NAD(+) synthetase n=4 Tax=Aliarcobacter butzleri TaxID=28197 RepID=A8EU83_ALIB4|nr:NAD+ synthase [Aliarcobacter butzleri]ABV67507.1 NH(3)-dependent NAD+ synthetase [Aliarcobacter butzleri RM4018]AGR77543.1 NAD synthetase, NH3-dependent [Aliarcobacter butzleri 7h1h]EFU69204.1 NAD+ synthetase [Aliarcobacter butzleri JV22]KLD97177.1 NAD synthetase [Aliarcobacter butzleri L349]KLE02273.1 NAD synthetase [Aliarcobacter butzleri L351]